MKQSISKNVVFVLVIFAFLESNLILEVNDRAITFVTSFKIFLRLFLLALGLYVEKLCIKKMQFYKREITRLIAVSSNCRWSEERFGCNTLFFLGPKLKINITFYKMTSLRGVTNYHLSFVLSGFSCFFFGRWGQQVNHCLYPKSFPLVVVREGEFKKWFYISLWNRIKGGDKKWINQTIRPLLVSVVGSDATFRVV